ncbi:MAG: manganese transporter, partial [Solirubrobacteraceae bacterium]
MASQKPAPEPRPAEPERGAGPERRAVLDAAHVGDIQGAFGTIRVHEPGQQRGARARLLALLAIMGPGLIVMVGDNDAGGV